MGLTNCGTCGKQVAKSASTCPNCGAKLKWDFWDNLLCLVFLLLAAYCILYFFAWVKFG
ncbi:MAG: zinc-ribbon domain-containing protein [Negativicutes bacterium]